MPTEDQTRLANARAEPRVMQLWWALRPLTSVVRFMQSGAHPDDEDSAMLAALAFRDGINLSYACSTRGEGGQNDIGTETGADLGALRTREMERACDVLDMRMYWHSEGQSDPITDFGFSKTAEETFGYWGRQRTLTRFVEIIRTDRPDILCPTFLDVPGQHGHHRAMTQAAHEVVAAAADPGFPSNQPPWQVRKLYLPAWSGAGQTYDDDTPPPPATMIVSGRGNDPMSGWSWERIGQMSRAFHRTQGMGVWVDSHSSRDWPLHLAEAHVQDDRRTLTSGLPITLRDLAKLPGAEPMADSLIRANAKIDAAISAFPGFDIVAKNAIDARLALEEAIASCPDTLRDEVMHRLLAKNDQLGRVIRISLGVVAHATVGNSFLTADSETPLKIDANPSDADSLSITAVLPKSWRQEQDMLVLEKTAIPSDPYRSAYDPARPTEPYWTLNLSAFGRDLALTCPFGDEPFVLPTPAVRLSESAILFNLSAPDRTVSLQIRSSDRASIDAPAGWDAAITGEDARISVPSDVEPGLYTLPVSVEDRPAHTVRPITYPHIAPTAQYRPATIAARILDVRVPDVRVGYIGGGNDRVGYWLSAMGADVHDLSDDDLTSDEALRQYDTIVVGIFAYRFRAELAGAAERLNAWCHAGGTLVTLYHRPWDNWDPDGTPPRRLEIGQPSLRWRVTDENSTVTHLTAHPVLSAPNPISAEDWEDWHKERGLYFAKSWDEAYKPLLAMNDPGEAPLHGALLVADIGQGRHVHTSLILHHQMEHLVPGAFRLMANLIAKRD